MSEAKREDTPADPGRHPEAVRELHDLAVRAAGVSAREMARHQPARRLTYYDVTELFRCAIVDGGVRTAQSIAEMTPRREEAALRAAGWRFIAVPRFKVPDPESEWRSMHPRLDWDLPGWCLVPPPSLDVPARFFRRKGEGIGWATGLMEGGGNG